LPGVSISAACGDWIVAYDAVKQASSSKGHGDVLLPKRLVSKEVPLRRLFGATGCLFGCLATNNELSSDLWWPLMKASIDDAKYSKR
jgi:hypothetical protein